MTTTLRTFPSTSCALAALALGAGCGDDPTNDPGPGDGDRPAEAILIAERFTTPDGRVMYMGAFPGLPSADVDISQMTELGEGDAFACGGAAFFFDADALALTRYEVGDDLALTRGQTIQVGQEGITGWTGGHVCASAERAYLFDSAVGRVVAWNPTTMVILDAFDLPPPTVPAGVDLFLFEPFRAGDLVYFPIEALNWDSLASGTALVGVFDLRDDSMTYAYDDGCGPGLSGHLAADGTFYRYQGYHAFFDIYGPDPSVPDCVLRIPPGGKAFDPSFERPLGPTQNMFATGDHTAVLLTIDPGATLPAADDPWAWFDLPIVPTHVDLITGETRAYTGLTNRAPMNSRKLTLDGQSYYQDNTFDAEGRITRTRLMRLAPAGATPVFTLQGGDFLTLERLW